MRRHPWWKCIAAGLLSLLAAGTASAQTYDADTVKSAFLYRFTAFVEWPQQSPPAASFTFAVLRADPVAAELTRMLPQHSVHGLPARVVPVDTPAAAAEAGAQVLFVGSGYRGSLRRVTEALAGRPVLVVSDRDDGLDDGAAVNFLIADRRVRFEISLPAATDAGLRIAPGLLSVAARVRGGPRSEMPCDAVLAIGCPLLVARR
jgi:hypothetical protein